jgi:hypothetical protein
MPAPLPPPDPNPKTVQQIASALTNLYNAGPTVSKFGTYFFLQNFMLSDFLALVGPVKYWGGQPVVRLYAGAPDVQVFMQDFSSLSTTAPKIFAASGRTQDFEVFICMDRVSQNNQQGAILLPYHTAKLLSSGFIYGLATRLILDKYKQAWSSVGVNLQYGLPIISAPPKNLPSVTPTALNAADWCQQYLQTLSSKLTSPATWTTAGGDYFSGLSLLTDSSVQVVGITMGWLAGDALTDGNATQYQADFWTLLSGLNQANYPNYTTVHVGMMVGYVFSYLSGFLSSERSKAMIAGNKPPDPLTDPVRAPPEIYSYLTSSPGPSTNVPPPSSIPANVGNQLFFFILQEFYSIAASNANKSRQYQGFLQGFQQGLLLGADVMYQLLYTEAYRLGYTSGFVDGYSQGYSAGWTAGYGAGYAQGQANWISGLSNIFNGLSNTLGSISSVLNNNQYVVSVISSLL